MDEVTKKIIVGYCLAIIVAILFVPWEVGTAGRDLGYAFILSPPHRVAYVNITLLVLEFGLLTAITVVAYVLRDKISKIMEANSVTDNPA